MSSSLLIAINLFYRRKSRYHGGHVAVRKRHHTKHQKSKRRLVTEIRQLAQNSSKMQEDIVKLTTPAKPQKLEVGIQQQNLMMIS